jgi:ppGpp synthetase/RelA/SpoT-type nucleotidyltranferase
VTISDDTIKKALQRYHREYDRYLKLAARVAEICRSEIVEGNAIRAQVTSRAKSPKSLEGKLRRFAATGKKSIADVDGVFDQIRDLAGVRIATYEQRHEDQIMQLVCNRFLDPVGQRPVHERKDKNREDASNFYRASHVEVFLTPADGVGTYANVMDVPCEVQVCSMMAHVWNEIEHDLNYKPVTGALSEQERNFLVMLGQSVRMGDVTIASLFSETERRQREQGGAFTDVYDFVARMRGSFPDIDFGRNAGPLFESLRSIRLVNPDSIKRLLNQAEPMTEAGQAALEAFSRRLQGQGDARFALEPNSSDLLLALLLPKIGRHLHSPLGEAPSEGVARVRWFAERFVDGPAVASAPEIEAEAASRSTVSGRLSSSLGDPTSQGFGQGTVNAMEDSKQTVDFANAGEERVRDSFVDGHSRDERS